MFPTSQTWNTLVAQDDHWFETRVDIAGVSYFKDTIIDMSADYGLFAGEQPGAGGCISGELRLTMLAPAAVIPRMATVRPYVRVTDGVSTSEWVPQGVFFIDTRETSKNGDGLDVLTLICFDAMLKAEADYPSSTHSWPYSDINTVKEIAKGMGLQSSINTTTGIDSRTITLMNKGYQISLPAGYSMREVLGNIAAMYAGNWIMSYDGKLLLVAINGIPPETNYLITAIGEPITFGGDRILV